ncbi:TIGR02117 family protein [Rhizobium sp. S95]|uniref:TIGR02117 family protein n=1 Tax=Ciceribacter sichuanensis TaxID=2949647 RepID=A0AAJ1BVJ2_9HYPH|nr:MULTISPECIES: TIGR02117 family protein [unclassified Ciceribacter]MCM2398678.1 TIGR02117 family protein [Ciceribacter sp. S95]MCO5957116.1 TIGR02117 family protein [Ciceribacter sp. S101]
MARILRRIVGCALLICLAVVAGMVVPRPLSGKPAIAATGSREILVLSNPIHTDIVLPLDGDVVGAFGDLIAAGSPLDHPDARYVVFGWGGRSFYIETPTWGDLKPMPVLKALTLDSSVLHVDVAAQIDLDAPGVQRFSTDEEGMDRLMDFIRATLVSSDGAVQPIEGASYGATDMFYEANGSFNVLAGCNTWTAAALRTADVRTGWWTPLPVTLRWSLGMLN